MSDIDIGDSGGRQMTRTLLAIAAVLIVAVIVSTILWSVL